MRLFRREEVDASVDLLVAGLGNPGAEHARDRHNVGWMVVDELARRHGAFKGKFRGRLADVRVGDAKLGLLKPETYMNESGALDPGGRGRSTSCRRSRSSSSTTTSTSRPRGFRRGSAVALRDTTASARSRSGSVRRTSFAAHRRRPARRGDPRPVSDYVLRDSRRRTTQRRSSRGPPTRSSASSPRASRRRSAASTERGLTASSRRPRRRLRQPAVLPRGAGETVAARRHSTSWHQPAPMRDSQGHRGCPWGRCVGLSRRRRHAAARSSRRPGEYDGPGGARSPPIRMDQVAAPPATDPARLPRRRARRRSERFRRVRRGAPARARVSEPVASAASRRAPRRARAGAARPAPRGRRRARRRRGASLVRAATRSRSSRAVASPRPPGLSRRRTSWASAPARSTSSRRAASSARPRARSPRAAAGGRRPAPFRSRVGDEPGIDGLAEELALAGYERVERVEERGQFAVRGGSSTSSRPPAASRFGSSSSATRSSRSARSRRSPSARSTRSTTALVYPAAERRGDLVELDARMARGRCGSRAPRSRPPVAGRRTSSGSPTTCARVWEEEQDAALAPRGARRARSVPARAAALVRGPAARDRRARARGGRERARRASCARAIGSSSRSRIAARPSGKQRLLRKVEARSLERGEPLPPTRRSVRRLARAARVRLARARARAPPDTPGLPQAPAARGRAARAGAASFADLRTGDHVVHEDHGVGQAPRVRDEGGRRRHPRLPPPRVPGRGPAVRPARAARQALALHRRRRAGARRCRSSEARPGRTSRPARARPSASWPASCSQLYAQRQRAEGVALRPRGDWLERLEASFPYRETDDQLRAIEAVKEDLEAPRPMDRLVCGDVGFGKTEVAVRAAFAVAVNGRQVLVLCPTTILAEQHWNTFRDRYRDFPVASRWSRASARQPTSRRCCDEFEDGKVEVLVGTHRILSRDVIPKELGLVVVDEEQRFGVAQKELLRSLRLEVDVLALSATPIPRTLHMSLSGLRDISIIETPPEGRRPIRTTVGEYDDELVRVGARARAGPRRARRSTSTTASRRSTRRRGSSRSSARICGSSSRTDRCPSASSRSGCTRSWPATPTCSSRRRSSSRGSTSRRRTPCRRARGHARARPALPDPRPGRPLGRPRARVPLLSRGAELTPEARARLATLADHTELGAGFQIAMRDLEIRGAGDLLGAEQSGHVAALGFELYVEMLNEAVAELSGQRASPRDPCGSTPASTRTCRRRTSQRRRSRSTSIAGSRSPSDEDELRELRAATEDRYGPLPEPVENLFAIQEAKLQLALLGADYLVYRGGRATVGPVALAARRAPRAAGPRSRRRSTRPRSARSRSGPMRSRGRSSWPMLSLPLAGPPERAPTRTGPCAERGPNTP